MTDDGLVSVSSPFSASETTERLLAALAKHAMTVFARIDHGANAVAAGMSLRPTDLIIFGNPKGGTVLMQDGQTAGLDLPLKALVWQDAAGKVWLSYNDPKWIAQRHRLGAKSAAAADAMTAALETIAREVTT